MAKKLANSPLLRTTTNFVAFSECLNFTYIFLHLSQLKVKTIQNEFMRSLSICILQDANKKILKISALASKIGPI